MYKDLLVQLSNLEVYPEKMSVQIKEDMVLTVLYLSREALNEVRVGNKVRSIFGCSLTREEIRMILQNLHRNNLLLLINGNYTLKPDTYEWMRNKSEGEVIERDRMLSKWIDNVVKPQYEELSDIDIKIVKSNINRFLSIIIEKANEMELENRELKKEVAHEKQRVEHLKKQLDKVKNENGLMNQQLNKFMEETEVIRNKAHQTEEQLAALQNASQKRKFMFKILACVLTIFILSIIDIYIFNLKGFEWVGLSKTQKTVILCSFPLSASIISLILSGANNGGKIFSALCAGVGVVVGIYKCL